MSITSAIVHLFTLSRSPVCLVASLSGAFVFRKRQKRRWAGQRTFDIERGQRRMQRKNREKRPTSTCSRDSDSLGKAYTCFSGETAIKEPKSDAEVAVSTERRPELAKVHHQSSALFHLAIGPRDSLSFSFHHVAQPPPTAQLKRHSKTSYQDYIAKHPPKYYWDQSRSM